VTKRGHFVIQDTRLQKAYIFGSFSADFGKGVLGLELDIHNQWNFSGKIY